MKEVKDKYPLVHCEHPKMVVNKYGETILVPCGHCKACMTRKASAYSQQCLLEGLNHRYTMFITLTYSNKNIPRLYVNHSDTNYFDLLPASQRTGDYIVEDEIVHSLTIDENDMTTLQRKFNIEGDIPSLCKEDLQKFLKRVRRQLNYRFNGTEEKIRYYAVGEYGPIHYRPHYHILLWFEEKSTYEALLQIIPQAWRYGYCNCQRTSGKSVNYVAGYTNSYTNVPSILRTNYSKPFCTHSERLGQGLYEIQRDKIYETPNRDSLSISYNNNGKHRTSFSWTSLKTRYFPKCLSYSRLSSQGKYDAYVCWNTARGLIGEYSVMDLTRTIMDALIDQHYKYFGLDRELGDITNIHLTSNFKSFFLYFACIATDGQYGILHTLKLGQYEHSTKDLRKTCEGRIYRALRVSKVFITELCNNDMNLVSRRIKDIDAYYSDCELKQLSSFYEYQQAHPEDVKMLYNETFTYEELGNSDMYKIFIKETDDFYQNSIKHKVLNDKNLIFNKM